MAIVMYSTPSCGYCKKAKSFFRAKQLTFREFDVSRDLRRADEMVRKSGQLSVPVIDIDGKIFVGFNPLEIEKVLK